MRASIPHVFCERFAMKYEIMNICENFMCMKNKLRMTSSKYALTSSNVAWRKLNTVLNVPVWYHADDNIIQGGNMKRGGCNTDIERSGSKLQN